MDLLFADAVPEGTVADLEARGHSVAVEPTLGAGDLPGRIAGVDVLVVRSTKVGSEVFDPSYLPDAALRKAD